MKLFFGLLFTLCVVSCTTDNKECVECIFPFPHDSIVVKCEGEYTFEQLEAYADSMYNDGTSGIRCEFYEQ